MAAVSPATRAGFSVAVVFFSMNFDEQIDVCQDLLNLTLHKVETYSRMEHFAYLH